MDEEESSDNNNLIESDSEEVYRGDIRAAILLKNAISDLRKKEQMEIKSLIDIGVGDSGASLLYGLIDRDIKLIVGLDKEYPSIPWLDSTKWEDLSGKTIKLIEADIYDEKEIEDLLKELKLNSNYKFSIGYLNKTLHHLRENDCQFQEGKKCKLENGYCKLQDCDDAIGNFLPKKIFNSLFQFANVILISEYFGIEKDNDKDTSQGGYLNIIEIKNLLEYLLDEEYYIRFYKPGIGNITNENRNSLLEALKSLDHMVFTVKFNKKRSKKHKSAK